MSPLPESYQSLGSAEKQRLLWENIRATEYDDADLPTQSMLTFLPSVTIGGLFSMRHLHYTFQHVSDVMDGKRRKIVHAFGSVCPIVLEPTPGHPFSGLLRGGAIGLVRIGQTYPGKSFTHGMAFKFFVDGRPSANVFVIPEINGQGDDHNVFARSGTTRLKEFHGLLLKVLRLSFRLALSTLETKGVSYDRMILDRLGAMTSDGSAEAKPCTPFELLFEPTPDAQTPSAREPDCRIKLKAIPPGTALYKLSGRASEDSEWFPIGTIRSTGPFIASRFGDQKLFFQHDPGIEQ